MDISEETSDEMMGKEKLDNGEVIPQDDIEESEEDRLVKGLDQEHFTDYLAIKHAVEGTDLSEQLVELAVKIGLQLRTCEIHHKPLPF